MSSAGSISVSLPSVSVTIFIDDRWMFSKCLPLFECNIGSMRFIR